MLWSNGPVDPHLADGCVYFYQHHFNVGQHVAHNEMLDECVRRGYERHIRVDDDCWLTTRTWLKKLTYVEQEIVKLGHKPPVLSPMILGLNEPPPTVHAYEIGKEIVEQVTMLGGIFRMAPMSLMRYFRWDERQAMGFGDATQFSRFCEATGTHMLRVRGVKASHGESTDSQKQADDAWDYEHDMLQYTPLGL